MTGSSLIEHADALDWLGRQEPGKARAVIFDAPYSRGAPMRGRPDGMAGQIAAPFSFMHRTLSLCARAVMPRGIVVIFGDFQLLPDLEHICSITGLREQAHFTWIRSRPAARGLHRRHGPGGEDGARGRSQHGVYRQPQGRHHLAVR
jgi:hypothetical protein